MVGSVFTAEPEWRSSVLPANYVTVDHLEPVDTDLLPRSPVLQPSQDDQGWENNQDEKRDHCFLSLALGAPSHEIDIWPGALFRIFLGLAGNGRAIELEADPGFRHD